MCALTFPGGRDRRLGSKRRIGRTDETHRSPRAATAATNSGSLPFTGLDVVLLLIGGGTLIGTGLLVRALARRVN